MSVINNRPTIGRARRKPTVKIFDPRWMTACASSRGMVKLPGGNEIETRNEGADHQAMRPVVKNNRPAQRFASTGNTLNRLCVVGSTTDA